MKLAIIGTRGIPNNHGGFEQFAEYLSVFLVNKGHDVSVYCSSSHPVQNSSWCGVNLIHKFDPESKIGTVGQFVYDFNCITDCRKADYDIILQLGYTSSSIWGNLLPKSSIIVTNMDGLEWKRTKYSSIVQRFLKYAENLAIKTSDHLISDSVGIQNYLNKQHYAKSTFIPYGANVFKNPEESILNQFGLKKQKYDLLIARLEPENNIETILDGKVSSGTNNHFVVVGKHFTEYGKYLVKKYQRFSKICFVGAIYNQEDLNNLRYFSNLYFHGHSVGGTNPSLLEAMASNCLIIAHDNIFNKSILENDAFYFKNSQDVDKHLKLKKHDFSSKILANEQKIILKYQWEKINTQYEKFLLKCLNI